MSVQESPVGACVVVRGTEYNSPGIEISLISGMILVQFLVIFIEVFLQRKAGENKAI